METIRQTVLEALTDFAKVAALANAEFSVEAISIEVALRPHEPPKHLPGNRMAVYVFFLNGQALKVGKVGPKSNARYTSQHYLPGSAKSNLARSILLNPARIGAVNVDSVSVGNWIKQNTDRVNLLLPAVMGDSMLSLLESFLQVRWKPLFEGRSND